MCKIQLVRNVSDTQKHTRGLLQHTMHGLYQVRIASVPLSENICHLTIGAGYLLFLCCPSQAYSK